jgi:hypothetical protein
MGRDHVTAEIKRLRIAVADTQHAAGAARHMTGMHEGSLSRMHDDAKQALETGAIVSYVRPFTRHGLGALDKDEWATVSAICVGARQLRSSPLPASSTPAITERACTSSSTQLPSAMTGASRNCGSTAVPIAMATRANL